MKDVDLTYLAAAKAYHAEHDAFVAAKRLYRGWTINNPDYARLCP